MVTPRVPEGARAIPLRGWLTGRSILVDEEDYAIVSRHRWTAPRDRHPIRLRAKIDGKEVQLSRLLMQPGPHRYVCHRFGDGLDCRRSSLKIVDNKADAGLPDQDLIHTDHEAYLLALSGRQAASLQRRLGAARYETMSPIARTLVDLDRP